MPSNQPDYMGLFNAGMQYVEQENQRQIKAEADFNAWQKAEQDFVIQQKREEYDRAAVEEMGEIVMNPNYSDAEANKRLMGVRMRRAMENSENPYDDATKILDEYNESMKDIAVLGQERQKLREQLTNAGFKSRKEAADARKAEADADKARKEADNWEAKKDSDKSYSATTVASRVGELVSKKETEGLSAGEQAELDKLQGKEKQKAFVATEDQLKQVDVLVKALDLEGGYEDMNEDEAMMLKGDVAQRAAQLQTENPNLSFPQAAQMALAEMKGSIGYDDGGLFGGDRPTYSPQAPKNAQPQAPKAPQAQEQQAQIPTVQSQAEYDAIPKGQQYKDSKGQIRIKQ